MTKKIMKISKIVKWDNYTCIFHPDQSSHTLCHMASDEDYDIAGNIYKPEMYVMWFLMASSGSNPAFVIHTSTVVL